MSDWDRLYYKYSHIGCPAAHMEDNCPHPDRCADNGRCIDLGPSPFDKIPCEHLWSAVTDIGQPYCAGCGQPWAKVRHTSAVREVK